MRARFPRFVALVAVVVLLAALEIPAAHAAVGVTNLEDKETLTYPVALVEGTASGREVRVANAGNNRPDGTNTVPVDGGRFKVLVELVEDRNDLELTSGPDRRRLTLTYRPATNDRVVHVVYLTAKDGRTEHVTQFPGVPQDYRAKLDTLAKLLQTATAEAMHAAGHGRVTFHPAYGPDGRVDVRTVRLPFDADVLRAKEGNELFAIAHRALLPLFPADRGRTIAVMGFSGYDAKAKRPTGHTALGGGSLALFSASGMDAWPARVSDAARAFTDARPVDDRRIWDDSAGRSTQWALASTTMGAVLHELGHTFGLPHPEPSTNNFMNRGFDHLNRWFLVTEAPAQGAAEPQRVAGDARPTWHPEHAERLRRHPWFRDAPLADEWFVTRWRVAAAPTPWRERPAPPRVGPADVRRLVKTLALRPETAHEPAGAAWQSLDLRGHYARAGVRVEDVVGYALARVSVAGDAPLRGAVYVCCDDGARVW